MVVENRSLGRRTVSCARDLFFCAQRRPTLNANDGARWDVTLSSGLKVQLNRQAGYHSRKVPENLGGGDFGEEPLLGGEISDDDRFSSGHGTYPGPSCADREYFRVSSFNATVRQLLTAGKVMSSQVESSQVKSSQVKSSQVKSSQVKSSQVKPGSLSI